MITAWIGSITFLAIAVLYVLLALGLPYGEFAMGGKYKILPKQMRVACAISVLIQLAAILFLLQAGHVLSIDLIAPIARGVCYFFAFYLFLNTVMNLFSKSNKEKLVMTPLSLTTAICFLMTALNS
ncbi:hypothetical protein CEH05_19660 [Halobacillus halophilus]|uniref:Uncharacterized protein n=1 Tax=Halobacillus halophilus (strain ATCC 35676 / DSM 2266 / JCM 20832 / KCTC 3685 / LMG 17431 / NBRC 102448 / NCIMB 2269) TaxID=866895 RepID=I0JT72_HALH3|nr:hypothetical protein [Halobacillus halophilus]ASF41260.1 hypothetical protein CEH05_19660 [Halobacillus halophilus]CCG47344.1 conserved hypothetical protein [Halobacillus halophilus DSM 2266]